MDDLEIGDMSKRYPRYENLSVEELQDRVETSRNDELDMSKTGKDEDVYKS